MKLSSRSAVLAATVAAGLAAVPAALGTTAGGDLETYVPGQGVANLQIPMAAGSSPSIATTSGGDAEIAYENTGGTVSANGSGAGAQIYDTPVQAGTSPAIASLGTYNDFEIAVNSGNDLVLVGAGDPAVATGYGMLAGSSPSITQDGNGYQAVIANPSGELWGYGAAASGDLGVAMRVGADPSVTMNGTNYMAAYENTATDETSVIQGSAADPSALGMRDPSSTSIAAVSTGYEITFVDNLNRVWAVGTAGSTDAIGPAASDSTPSIAALPGSDDQFAIAYTCTNGDLCVYVSGQAAGEDTGQPMAAGTSPSITGLSQSAYEVGFQGPVPQTTPTTPTPTAPMTGAPSTTGGATGTTTVTSSKRPTHGLKRLRDKLSFGWIWRGRYTRLRDLSAARLPSAARLTLRCEGPRCGVPSVFRARASDVRKLVRRVHRHIYRVGDLLYLTVRAHGYSTQRGVFVIRRGRAPLTKQVGAPPKRTKTKKIKKA